MESPTPDVTDAQQFWEQHYSARDRVWSGRVNARLAEVAEPLNPGRALDLGCGEGADAIWLAEQGWRVVATDISETALQRAAADAGARNLLNRIDFERHDLSDSFPAGTFDLVSAQFLHSPVRLDREPVLCRAAAAVAPGGLLMIVDHASAPRWAWKLDHDYHFKSAVEVVESLELNAGRWHQVRVEAVEREAVGPEGQVATVSDNVIVLKAR
jgi:SAM-dependent methyltransferase